MKVSEWLRLYQISGQVPEESDPNLAFWAGWMLGPAAFQSIQLPGTRARIDAAIKAAEFIEDHAKGGA